VRSELAFERFPSLFSKSIGLTLWGIVDDPFRPRRPPAEVAVGDVEPHVEIQIEQHSVGSAERVEQRREVVTGVDLRREGFKLEAQPSTNSRAKACQSTVG